MLNQIAAIHGTGVAAVTNSYESIATVTVGSSVSTISFTSIPSTYKHLQVRLLARSTRVNAGDYMNVRFNSDSSAVYARHNLNGDGSGAGAGSQINATAIEFNRLAAASASANVFGAGVIDILEYANTNINKTARALIGYDNNGSGEIHFQSGLWRSTSAITSITFTCNNDFAANSQFALYGIRG